MHSPKAREDAARWFLRMRETPVPAASRQAFDAWLNAHPDHAREYAGFDLLWQDFGSTSRSQALASAAMAQRRRQRRKLTQGLLGLGGFGMLGWLVHAQWRAAEDAARFTLARETGIGESAPLALPDGSQLRLGGDTHIDVRFSRHGREVQLLRGQALFDVAHDPARPFTVDCAGARITVVGTQFSVDRLPGSVRVSVQQGVVRVAARDNPQALLELRAGEVGAWHDAAPRSTPQRLAGLRVEDAFAIERGLVVFELATLEEVAATLSRYHTLPVRVQSLPATHTPRITAAVQLRQLDDFLRALPHLGAVRVQRGASEIVLSAR